MKQKFVFICRLLALAICLLVAVITLLKREQPVDLPQYYMGGLIAREGRWESLYPIPIPRSTQNAGYPDASAMRPEFARRAAEIGAPNTFRFIQSPPVALAFAPLSICSLHTAIRIWVLTMALCVWISAVQAGLIYRKLSGSRRFWEGLVVLGASALPRSVASIMVGNVSPAVSCCLGGALLAMLDNRCRSAAWQIFVGAVAKYSTAVLIPVAVIRNQWKVVWWTAGICTIATLIVLPFGGVQPYRTFAFEIWPTLQRPTMHWTNQSVWGAAAAVAPPGLLDRVVHILSLLKWLVLGAILCMIFICREMIRRSDEGAIATVLCLLLWLQLFGPITWGHYAVYFLPFSGWLAFRVLQGGGVACVAAVAAALVFIPWRFVEGESGIRLILGHFSFILGMLILLGLSSFVLLRSASGARCAIRMSDPGQAKENVPSLG